MVRATFPSASIAGTITIYPTNSVQSGSTSSFLDGVKIYGSAVATTATSTALKAIEYKLDSTYNDITGMCRGVAPVQLPGVLDHAERWPQCLTYVAA